MRNKSAQEIWEVALGELQMQVNKANYQTWLQKTVGLAQQNGHFVVGVPNAFVAEYLDRNQRSLIERTLTCLTNHDAKVLFEVDTNHQNSTGSYGEPPEISHRGQTGTPQFNSKYTFASFIVGSSNRLAYTAAMGVTENPGHGFNPLFIYGEGGLGKTHLLHAIGHAALASNTRVAYASAERFTNELVQAIQKRKTEEFHNKYRNVDMLLIDDIQFITGKEQTEESFFHTFNELHNANRQIVITSDCPPKAMSPRLRSRFEWGLIVDIHTPDEETRLSILQAKTKGLGVEIPPDVLTYIAQRSLQNIRELEGYLNRVIAFSRLVKALPTIELAAQSMEDIAGKIPKESNVTPGQVIEAVANSFQLTPDDLKGRKRNKETSLARQVAMYLIRQKTNSSLEQIGKEFGDRDHSTVIHACDRMAGTLANIPYLKRKLHAIEQEIQTFSQKPRRRR